MTEQEAFVGIMNLSREHNLGLEPDGFHLVDYSNQNKPMWEIRSPGYACSLSQASKRDIQALTATASAWLEERNIWVVGKCHMPVMVSITIHVDIGLERGETKSRSIEKCIEEYQADVFSHMRPLQVPACVHENKLAGIHAAIEAVVNRGDCADDPGIYTMLL